VKFGKTEAGAVWLDPERTSPYRFYQFWLNTEDADVGRYLRFFTLLAREEIEALETSLSENPGAREAQKALAASVTERVHGAAGLARAEQATAALFGGALDGLSAAEVEDIFSDVPSSACPVSALAGAAEDGGLGIVEFLADHGVLKSRGEARRAIEQGGIYLNGMRVEDVARQVTAADALHGRFLVIRKGKRNYHLVRLEG
jgi:tyrosyl-tRNA synthetase